ncbi:heterokaryon incompatibility Het-C [Apiospora saccharicola]|uniref:Heterokaryon incompatibility Het-C n=1 Tax=Apiospora saccharicola TaxID=335842 RepID=A0ABR1UX51_9PEZI
MLSAHHLLLVFLICALFAGGATAFGAGSLPLTSEFNGYVWRHGDITEVLQYLPFSFVTQHRFTQLQRKQIYFGNWLRDFSQVIDTTCLQNIPEPILRAIVSVMGFMEFGFATDEFDVTRDRLGCYTHVEHIDNPHGYDEDAKEIDERLRGPVDPRELEFDAHTGMKNYIANSGQGWDTSADYIRKQLKECIEFGRKGRKDAGARKESFIRLGAALHTLEDFAAHSNYVELCLHELGETDVFAFVGDECRLTAPGWRGRRVPPLVTGTFGMLDIFHSMLGEADDMAILQSKGTLGELESKLGYGTMAFEQLFDLVKTALGALGKFTSDASPLMKQLDTIGEIFKKATEDEPKEGADKPPPATEIKELKENASGIANPNLLWQSIEPVLFLHDRMKKWLQESAQESEPQGPDNSSTKLGEYTDQLVFKFLAVMLESAVKELRNAVKAAKDKVDEEAAKAASAAVYEDGSDASDPSHSDLSKDHFSNVLNQPAGLVATVTTNWATQRIVKCWDNDDIDADETIDEILKILHHPAFVKKKSAIQHYMFLAVKKWWRGLPGKEKNVLRGKLTKASVKNRGHEAHELTLKDLEGRRKGAAVFPGSRPRVRNPPRKDSSFPIAWAIQEASADIRWVASTLRDGLTDPRHATVELLKGARDFATGSVRAVFTVATWFAGGAAGIVMERWFPRS